jgi:hypothetical protein
VERGARRAAGADAVSLTHYVVVRRDLTHGAQCAQIAHAAGESFYLLHDILPSVVAPSQDGGGAGPSGRASLIGGSSEKERPPSQEWREVGGSSPPPRANIPRPTAVILGARNEHRLLRLERLLLAHGVPHVAVREPDAPFCGQLVAIGIVPGPKHELLPFVADFNMLPSLPNEERRA